MSEELYELPDGLLIRDAGEAAQQWANLANRMQEENERLRAMADGKFAEILEDAERWSTFQRLIYRGKMPTIEVPRGADQIETYAAINATIDAARGDDDLHK